MRPQHLLLACTTLGSLACGCSKGERDTGRIEPLGYDSGCSGAPEPFAITGLSVRSFGSYTDDSLWEGNADVYVSVYLDGVYLGSTSTASGASMPAVWEAGLDEPFPLLVIPCEGDSELSFDLWDEDTFGDDYIGTVYVAVGDLDRSGDSSMVDDGGDNKLSLTLSGDSLPFDQELDFGRGSFEPCEVNQDGMATVDDWYVYVGSPGGTIVFDTPNPANAFNLGVWELGADSPEEGDPDLSGCSFRPDQPGEFLGACPGLNLYGPDTYHFAVMNLGGYCADEERGGYVIDADGPILLQPGYWDDEVFDIPETYE